jgi:hypothetical protein
MIGVQPPSFEMSLFPELLGPWPHFCHTGGYTHMQRVRSEVREHTAFPYLVSGTIASMSPHMIGVQPPSFEMSLFPELLGPWPHFCHIGGYVRQQWVRSDASSFMCRAPPPRMCDIFVKFYNLEHELNFDLKNCKIYVHP